MPVTVGYSKDGVYEVMLDNLLIWWSRSKAETGAAADFINHYELDRRDFVRARTAQGGIIQGGTEKHEETE